MPRVATAMFDYLDVVPHAIFICRDQEILWANAAAVSLIGYSNSELAGTAFVDLIAPVWRGLLPAHDLRSELQMITAQGNLTWVEMTNSVVTWEDQSVDLITLSDIRERKTLEVALAQRESLYRRAIEAGLDGFYLLQSQRDETGQIVDFIFADMNAQGEAMLPFSREQLIGHRLCELMPFQRTLGFLDKYIWVTESVQVIDEDFELVLSSNVHRWYHHQVVPIDGGVAIFTRDITERKQTEMALRESEERYRALFDQSNDGVVLTDLSGQQMLPNQQAVVMFGYSAEEIIGMHFRDFVPEREASASAGVVQALIDGEKVPIYERVFRRKDGSEFLAEVNVALVRDTEGKALYIQSIIRDITRRKEIENALRESRERYRIISELISDYAFAFRVEPDGSLAHEWITESFTRMTGFTHEEIDAAGTYALFHPEDRVHVDRDMRRVIGGETVSGEYRIITKDGKTRWVHIFRKPVWDEPHQRVIRYYGVAQDITARRQSEEELRKSEETYRLIAENASDIIASSDASTGIMTYISSACRVVLGFAPEEMTGQPVMSMLHPDEYQDIYAFFAVLQNSITPMTITCRVLRKSGDYGWFEITAKALRDPDSGIAKEYITVSRDITQRKEMEAILLEQEHLRLDLVKEQELSEVKSSLMRTISHEFRTPLSVILTATDFLDRYIEHLDMAARNERLQSIRVQVKRLSDMLDDISFVVQGTLHHMTARPALTKLEALCRSILEEIETTIGKNHHFVFDTDGQLQEGIADKAIIIRIMGNLLSNAVKYSPENSTVSVSLYREDDNAVLRVSDEGIGIASDEQKQIFEPFYRSSSMIDEIGGTGLGLSIVKDCVDLHGGTITVESTLGNGTSFTVYLPQT